MFSRLIQPTIIYLPAIDRILKDYFSLLKISRKTFWEKLDIDFVRKIFLLSLRDFYQKKITLEELSAIALRLYYNDKSWTPFDIDSKDVELGTILGHTEEISYYRYKYKETKNPQYKESYDSFLREINDYYNRNKHFLEV
jgi:hypothetical protein